MKFVIRHTFDVDPEIYWKKIFFQDDYNDRLYLEALGFLRRETVEQKEEDGIVVHRKVLMEPKPDAPAVVRKLVGDSLTYHEVGHFDPKDQRWKYEVILSTMANKVKIFGEYWLEPLGDKRCERFCSVDVNVKIFGVGGVIERFVEKSTKESYEDATVFTRAFIKEKGL